MSYRDIVVHVKSHTEWTPHLDVALRVSRTFGARLGALYAFRAVATLKAVFGQESVMAKERAEKDAHEAARVEAKFRAALARHGVDGGWMTGEGDASELLTWAGRFHDLVVVEQTDRAADEIGFDVAEQSVLASGRPTLVVPTVGRFDDLGRSVVVAWNGSREAARALQGALPFIAQADRVVVLEGQGKETFSTITRFPNLTIRDYLARHAAQVETRPFAAPPDQAGAMLLAEARASGATLLVMGAYGRSWFTEWVLGGATRHVLRHMNLPVLMSH